MMEVQNTEKLNNQTAFNKAAIHLLRQGKPSIRDDNPDVCMYRGPNGLMCGVGALIPDEKYKPKMEGVAIHAFMVDVGSAYDAHLADFFSDVSVSLLGAIQSLHDCWMPTSTLQDWVNGFKKIARDFSLDDSIIDSTTEEIAKENI